MSLHHIPRPLQRLLNFVFYQATWFTGIYNGDAYAIPAVIALLLFHTTIARDGEWKLIGFFAVTGICLDSLWYNLGLVSYPTNNVAPLLPLWMMALWFAVATTLTHAINPFFRRPLLAGLVALFLAPYSYSIGVDIGVIEITEAGSYAIGIGWALLIFTAGFIMKYIRPDMVGLEH